MAHGSPLAKARRIFRSHCFSALLSSGMKKRIKNGAAEIRSVAIRALNQTDATVPSALLSSSSSSQLA